jgi:hypothetical protein
MAYQYHRADLYRTANCPTLVRNHMADVAREFSEYDAIAQKAIDHHTDWVRKDCITLRGEYANPIVALMDDIDSLRKMVVRIIQVQNQQINKYRKSIRDWRKTVKRGAPPSLESVTMETMIQMSLRVIKDMSNAIPSLIQPVVTQIRGKMCRLHERMFLFKQFTESDRCTFGPDDCRCNCPPCCHGQCYECHEGNCCRDWQTIEP